LSPARARGTTELFRFHDGRIDESSGIVVSSYSDGVFFTHNDSGDRRGRFFAVDRTGRTLADLRPDERTASQLGLGGIRIWSSVTTPTTRT
jgi:hypothetical protein